MISTPRTDCVAGGLIDADEVVPADFARQLERENAGLRQVIDAMTPCKCQHTHGDACAMSSEIMVLREEREQSLRKVQQLERENAKLRNNFMFAESEIILLREDREELRELAARMAKEMREIDHEFCSLVDYDNLQNKI